MNDTTEKQAHTAGPWRQGGFNIVTLEVAIYPEKDFTGKGSTAIAFVSCGGAEGMADARLIAAAPELLDAARDAEAVIDQACRCHTLDAGGDCQACLAAAALRTAIARAEGQD